MNGSQTCKGDGNIKAGHNMETKKAMRCISMVTSDFDPSKFNLRQEFDNAVACLISCESIINALQKRLVLKYKEIISRDKRFASKDMQLASKDKLIKNLEGKIVQMLIKLALAKMTKDELQHKLKTHEAEREDAPAKEMVALAKYQPKSKKILF